jgi:phosphoribosylaminoimidazole-succinocarboxamide synthase
LTGGSPRQLPGWVHIYSGKVRDLYRPSSDGFADNLLVVASDRVSAFDQILEPEIPGKGQQLTRISNWWFDFLGVPNHRAENPPPSLPKIPAEVSASATLVRKLEMIPIECVVRAFLVGSGWLEYQRTGAVCGVTLPAGLNFGDPLPEPIFTPAYKAPIGEHDENISMAKTAEIVGEETAVELEQLSLEIFRRAQAAALARGLILADTKLEFGRDPGNPKLVLADEVLTPDSSRYWDSAAYASGIRDQSFDKQIVRNWLAENWLDREQQPPRLPAEIVSLTSQRYQDLLTRLTG